MKSFITILFILLFQINYAQNLSFESKAIDENSKTIPYVTVFLQKNQAATTSNFDGEVKLVINKKALPDTLVIRHIAFETQKIFLTSENINAFEHVILKDKLNEVGFVEIRAFTAEQIIKKAIDSIYKNYYAETFTLMGFYRQAHKENDKYVRLIECYPIVKEKIYDRNSTVQKESFHIEWIRRSNVYERNGDKHGDHLVDLFLEDPINYSYALFLNKHAYRLYDFSFDKKKLIIDSTDFTTFIKYEENIIVAIGAEDEISFGKKRSEIAKLWLGVLGKKIDKDFDKPLLSTVRGAGYMLHDPDMA